MLYFFPVHFCFLEEGSLNLRLNDCKRYMKRINQTSKTNEITLQEATKIAAIIKSYNQRRYDINQLYVEIDALESCIERSPQLVIQTVLFIIANYYKRVLVLFDELFFIPISIMFIINWIVTLFSIAKSVLRYRNARRFPASSNGIGMFIQAVAVSIWIAGKTIFISGALANMPYLHPIAPVLQIIIVYLAHLLSNRCRPSNSFETTIGTATTSAFFRPVQWKLSSNIPTDNNKIEYPSYVTNRKGQISGKCHDQREDPNDKLEKYHGKRKRCLCLQNNGGILIMLGLEILSFVIFMGLGKFVRMYRNRIDVKQIHAHGSLEEYFLPWFEIIFVDIKLSHHLIVIAGLIGIFGVYLVFTYLYYKVGHPKKLILNNIQNEEDVDSITNNLWANLGLYPPNGQQEMINDT